MSGTLGDAASILVPQWGITIKFALSQVSRYVPIRSTFYLFNIGEAIFKFLAATLRKEPLDEFLDGVSVNSVCEYVSPEFVHVASLQTGVAGCVK